MTTMSRRSDNKAAQNQQTIKSLLKLDANKTCADCKKTKHPRWASWNLGVFLCIRCSGIHRGMGTHISRVKSVDLDSWTDEQLQSIMRWGNGRANKYWEAKLAPGHVPSDAKIENFIRTKYESKRWVMDGPMPDPSTLDDGGGGDDNVPLNVVREKSQLDRSAARQESPQGPSARGATGLRRQPAESFDLIGSDDTPLPAQSQPSRSSPMDAPGTAVRGPPPPKSSTPSQLLGGLDFLGETPERPSSAGQQTGGLSRPDLKQSILSLYASAPKPPVQSPPSQSHDRQPSFGGMGSPQATTSSAFGGMGSPQASASAFGGMGGQTASSSAFGGMNDAFAGLNFGSSSTTSPKPSQGQQQSSFSQFGGLSQMSPPIKSNPAPPRMSSPPLSGGGFFDAGPKPPPKPAQPKLSSGPSLAVRKVSNASDGFGDFTSTTGSAPTPAASRNQSSNNPGLLDFTQTMVNIQPVQNTPTSASTNSVFNLSQPKPPQASQPPTSGQAHYASKLPSDPWGGNDWATPDPAPAPKQNIVGSSSISGGGGDFGWGSTTTPAAGTASNAWSQPASSGHFGGSSSGGWGDDSGFGAGSSTSQPKVAAEEDFGGWSSSNAAQPSTTQGSNSEVPKSFGGSDDLYSNVWG